MDEQPVGPTDNAPVAPVTNPTPAASTAPATAAPLPGVPDTWPGAFGIYKYSKQAVKLNLQSIIVIWILNVIITSLVELVLKQIGEIIAILISGLLTAALILVMIEGIRGQRIEVGDAFSKALPLWLKMIGLNILIGVSLIVSILLLIVPFFFVAPRLALSYYFLVDKKMGILEAYKASWAATKGNAGKVWGIIGATFLMVLLMITIIGIPFSIYFVVMYGAAIAVLYEFITTKGAVAAPAAAAPAAAAVTTPTPADVNPPTSSPSPESPNTPAPNGGPSDSDTPPTPPAPLVQ